MQDDDPEWLKPRGRGWRVETKARIHDNPWFALDAFDVIAPTDVPAKYYLQSYKNVAVGVVALDADGMITLVGQWRFPFDAYSWELPEGGSPKGDDPLDGAKRELREEAGLAAAEWRQVLAMQLSNSSSDEIFVGYLATGLTGIAREPDPTEELAVIRVPFREALKAATTGRIQDAITVAMLLRIHHMAHEGELNPALSALVLD